MSTTPSAKKRILKVLRIVVSVGLLGYVLYATLTHEGVLPDYEARTAQGWSGMLAGLAAALGEGEGALTRGAPAA